MKSAAILAALILAFVAGVFLLLFLLADALQTKPVALAVLMLLIIVLSTAVVISGALLNHAHAQSIQPRIDRREAIDAPFSVLPERKQIPPPDAFIQVSDRMSVRQSQIENTAVQVYEALWPHTAPTRANIKRSFPQLQSDGFISAVQAYLQQRGRASGGGQGREYKWIVTRPTDEDAAF
jgi:hypothetical protein